MSLVNYRASNHPQQTSKRGAKDDVDDRGTDPAFIAQLEARFGKFTLDVAAAEHNARAPEFYTREDDGLSLPWSGRVWCNPPYSDCGAWVRKAWETWNGAGFPLDPYRIFHGSEVAEAELIVMLLPANRVEQAWWQDLVEPYRDPAPRCELSSCADGCVSTAPIGPRAPRATGRRSAARC